MHYWVVFANLLLFFVLVSANSDPCAESDLSKSGAELCAFRNLLEDALFRVNGALATEAANGDISMPQKRKSSYIRFGRSDPTFSYTLPMEKRKSAYVRFGKRTPLLLADKRKSSYIRFG